MGIWSALIEAKSFQAGLDARLQKLQTFIDAQREAIIANSRSRAGEYLLAVHRKRHQPTTENFMLLTEKGDLNPASEEPWR